MIKSVIFDWSGVLSDDWDATWNVTNEILELKGYPRVSREKFKDLYELPWMNFYKKLGVSVDVKWEYGTWEKLFPKYCHTIRALPQGKECLEWLHNRGIKCFVLSAHNHQLLSNEIEQYGYKDFIYAVKGSNEDKRKTIEAFAASHEIEKETSLYVGDMCHDMETARLAGIRSVAVLSGYDKREKLEREKPDFILNHVGELPSLVEKLDGEKQGSEKKAKANGQELAQSVGGRSHV